MKNDLAFLLLGATCILGCTPKSDNAGDLLDTGSDGGSESSDGTVSGPGEGSGEGSASGSASGSTDDGGTTGGGVPAVCEALGWVAAYDTFQQMSAAAGDTYWYRVLGGTSGFFEGECPNRTTIVVENGEVVRRIFEVLGPPEGDPEGECDYGTFVEEKDELGTMDETFWSREPWTLDMLYVGCCQEVLTQSAEENDLTFTTFDDGMMQACSYFPVSCADGCSDGPEGYGYISIDSMGFGPLPPD